MRWEVSIIEFKENGRIKWKVTRRLSEYGVSETKIFHTKEEAMAQIKKWLE